ncbi:HD domain-containing protein [Apibacter sp. wkB309]|uniref:HD domain-containing protein n=1 Tax=Apibacter sp. wkB309 TaxID=1679467 RepID=UPI000CFA00C6|nr:HD domain-containing protein [Apibacter sp. wkB309]PQL90017.1 metal-dependent phosphohydrolase [Apibacter sp. wkB309]
MELDLSISIIRDYIKNKHSSDKSGHDYWHIERVVTNAQNILLHEKADRSKVLLAAWLHDVGDYKLHNGTDRTEELVFPLLSSLSYPKSFIEDIIKIINEVSYKGGHNPPPTSLEAKIVQDADRLDAIGAVGIARAFAYGGTKGRELFDPNEKPTEYTESASYQKSTSCTINHFYEKLLKLKDLMNTNIAKEMAEERHLFMLKFLEEFYKEIGYSR